MEAVGFFDYKMRSFTQITLNFMNRWSKCVVLWFFLILFCIRDIFVNHVILDKWKMIGKNLHFYYQLYPTLGCDIQCFQANTDHGGSRIFRRSDWLYHSEQMGPIWGCVPCQKKSPLCVKKVVSGWNKVFPKDNSSCEVFMETNCPYAGINKWMEKSNIFFNNETCGNTMVKPQTVRYRLLK